MAVLEKLVLQRLHVRDEPHRHEREDAEVRLHHKRLRIGVGNDAKAHMPTEMSEILLELRAERRVLDVVNRPQKLPSGLQHRHAATVRPQVGMVVDAEEQVRNAVFT